MARGNRKQPVFFDDEDRNRFLSRLREYKKRHGFLLYAYALMGNHVHLLIETKKIPLSKIMQSLIQCHTQWHNWKYSQVGHLFQGRYKAILCDKNVYLLELVRYIHLNPARAGVKNPMQYEWTSHRLYVANNDLVDSAPILSHFASSRKPALEAFEQFIKEAQDKAVVKELLHPKDQRVLGDNDFFNEVMDKADEPTSNQTHIQRNLSLDEIGRRVAKATGVSLTQLKGKMRGERLRKARSLFARLARLYSDEPCSAIASYLDRTAGAINHIVSYMTITEFDRTESAVTNQTS